MPPVQELDLSLDQVRPLLAQGRAEHAAAGAAAVRPAEAAAVVAAPHPADRPDALAIVQFTAVTHAPHGSPRTIDPPLVAAPPLTTAVAADSRAISFGIVPMPLPMRH